MLKLLFSLSVLSLIGYGIGFVNQIMIANKFGTSPELDLYLLALSVVNFGWFFIGPLSELSFSDFFKKALSSTEEGSIYFSKTLNLILVLGVFMSTIIYLFSYQIYTVILPTKTLPFSNFKINLFHLLPIILLTSITQYLQVVLNTMSRYIAHGVGKIITASISVVFLFYFFDVLGINALIWGMEIGLFVLCIIQFYLLISLKIYYFPLVGVVINKTYYHHLSALSLTYLLSAFQVVFERFVFMSFGIGILSAYNYSQTLLQVPQMIVVNGIVTVVSTEFINKIHQNDIDNGLDKLFDIALESFFVAFATAITISIFGKEIIYLLFYRGKFSVDSINNTSFILRILIFSFPLIVFNNILGRALVALKKIKLLIQINIFSSLSVIVMLLISYKINNIYLSIITLVSGHFLIIVFKLYKYQDLYLDGGLNLMSIRKGIIKKVSYILIYAVFLLLIRVALDSNFELIPISNI